MKTKLYFAKSAKPLVNIRTNNNNILNAIPQVGPGEGGVYATLSYLAKVERLFPTDHQFK